MGKGFDISAFASTVKPVSESDTSRPQIEYIDIDLLDADEGNFYSMDGIDGLAASIEMFGLQQPIRIRPSEAEGRFVVTSGHRRRAALQQLIQSGREEFRQVPCIRAAVMEHPALQKLALIAGNRDTRKLTRADIAEEVLATTNAFMELEQDGYKFEGKKRDLIAQVCGVSSTRVGVLKVISEKLVPVYQKAWKEGKVPEASAYALARMRPELQEKIWFACKDSLNSYSLDNVRKYDEQHPGWEELKLTCPDGHDCTHAAAFLRKNCRVSYSSVCFGKCCMECDYAKREWSPCAQACAKAKAKRKEDAEKNAAKQKRESEKATKQEMERRTKVAVPIKEFWKRLAAQHEGQFSDRVIDRLFGGFPSYRKDIKEMLSDCWKPERYSDPVHCWPQVGELVKYCREHGVSADYLFGLTDQPHGGKAETAPGPMWLPLDREHWPERGQLVVLAEETGLGGYTYTMARCVDGYGNLDTFEDASSFCISANEMRDIFADWWLPVAEAPEKEGST